MSTATSVPDTRNVDNGLLGQPSNSPAPAFPDVGRLGHSRVGRKLARKAWDAYYVDLRQHEGRPAKSGPPIPNSEKRGARSYYSMEQVRLGGRRSGAARRQKAQKRWREVMALRRRGHGIRQIARLVGYSAAWVCKLVKRLLPSQPKPLTEHIHHQPIWAAHGSRTLTLAVLYRRAALQMSNVPGLPPPKRNRLDRPFSQAQSRVIGRRGKGRSAGLLGALGGGSGVAFGLALAACRELAGLPIDEAVRTVNREFGWGQRGPEPGYRQTQEREVSRVRRRTRRQVQRSPRLDTDHFVNGLYGWGQR